MMKCQMPQPIAMNSTPPGTKVTIVCVRVSLGALFRSAIVSKTTNAITHASQIRGWTLKVSDPDLSTDADEQDICHENGGGLHPTTRSA